MFNILLTIKHILNKEPTCSQMVLHLAKQNLSVTETESDGEILFNEDHGV